MVSSLLVVVVAACGEMLFRAGKRKTSLFFVWLILHGEILLTMLHDSAVCTGMFVLAESARPDPAASVLIVPFDVKLSSYLMGTWFGSCTRRLHCPDASLYSVSRRWFAWKSTRVWRAHNWNNLISDAPCRGHTGFYFQSSRRAWIHREHNLQRKRHTYEPKRYLLQKHDVYKEAMCISSFRKTMPPLTENPPNLLSLLGTILLTLVSCQW